MREKFTIRAVSVKDIDDFLYLRRIMFESLGERYCENDHGNYNKLAKIGTC